MSLSRIMDNKFEKLKSILRECGSVAVAFSSGVDSTFLLKVARDVLGREKVLAVTIASSFNPHSELSEALEFCHENDIAHRVINVDILSHENITVNPKDRCYLCKKIIFSEIMKAAKEAGINEVLEGSNIDDMSDYRPGMKAIAELKVKSPLKDAMLTKAEIRALSKTLNLKTFNKPSYACLASRFVYGELITEEKLKMVEKAEEFLRECGFIQNRVRIHGNGPRYRASIEFSKDDLARLDISDYESGTRDHDSIETQKEGHEIISNDALSTRDSDNTDTSMSAREITDKIISYFREIGFSETVIDPKGYRTGSMNEAILK